MQFLYLILFTLGDKIQKLNSDIIWIIGMGPEKRTQKSCLMVIKMQYKNPYAN